MNNAKQNTGKELKDGVKTEKCPKDDANGKPPDYNQSMGWPHLMPQHNPQIKYGIQSLNAGQYQHSFPVYNPQGPFMLPNSSQIQHVNAVDGPARGPNEEEKAEKMRVQLRKRKIPEENWRY